MKNLLKKFFTSFGIRLFAYFKKKYEQNEVNTVKTKFLHIGENVDIQYPCRIINPQYIYIGDNFRAWSEFRIEAIDNYWGKYYNPRIVIGRNVIFHADCHIGCINEITIGNNVLAGSRVLITDHYHGKTDDLNSDITFVKRDLFSKGKVFIDENVWIGEGVCIMPDVSIGKNCIIGANSVVTRSFPDNCVIAGSPAKIVKKLK